MSERKIYYYTVCKCTFKCLFWQSEVSMQTYPCYSQRTPTSLSQLQEIYMFLKIAACVYLHNIISLSQFQEIYVSKNSSVCLFLCLHINERLLMTSFDFMELKNETSSYSGFHLIGIYSAALIRQATQFKKFIPSDQLANYMLDWTLSVVKQYCNTTNSSSLSDRLRNARHSFPAVCVQIVKTRLNGS